MRPLSLLALLPLSFAVSAATADPADGDAKILAHHLTARFEPSAHRLVARDVIDVDTSAGRRLRVDFTGALTGGPEFVPSGAGIQETTVPKGATSVTVKYAKEVFDGVVKREDLSFRIGNSTRGLVSEKGIYLSPASGWYPAAADGSLARFDVTTYVPAPFVVVTQGGVPERSAVVAPTGWASDEDVEPPEAAEGPASGVTYAVSKARAAIPTDGLNLSAGPYAVSSKTVDGVVVSTYLLAGEAADGALWLDAAAEVVARYETVLGSYPHPKFDVVENFFSTGTGMPSYALLGDDVIRCVTQGAKASHGKIPPGTLDPAYVHGWFGNGLFVDPKDGNWCEALTTYVSGTYAKEMESKEAGDEHRRGILEKYAIRVSGESDTPVRLFRGKTEDKDDDIGCGKGSMIFHLLRRRLGDARFFDAVRTMCVKNVGRTVSWTDWLQALDGEWVRPWLERKGLPRVRLASATAWPGDEAGTWSLRCEAVVEGPRDEPRWPAMDLDVDVNGKKAGTVHVDGQTGVWRGTAREDPTTVEIDARYEALRRIADEDLPSCLGRTMEAKRAVVKGTRSAVVRGGEEAVRVEADVLRLASDEFEGRRPGTEGHRSAQAFLLSRLAEEDPAHPGSLVGFGLGVADLTSPRDLVLTTDAGTETLKDAFRPLFTSAEHESGKPLPFAEGAGAVPLPATIPDTSPEGVKAFQETVEAGSAPAILLSPTEAARKALAPLLDAPNALTPEATADLDQPGPDGRVRLRPPIAPWIAARRVHAFPAAAPTRVPVLVLEEAAAARLRREPKVRSIDFAVSFSADREAWAKGAGGENVVAYWPAPDAPSERPPVVLVSAHYDSFGKDGGALYRGADDNASGVACVLEALKGLRSETGKPGAAKRGLVVAFFDGEEWGLLGSRAFVTDLGKAYDVTAVVNVDAVGRVRDHAAFVVGLSTHADLGAKAAEALAASGLRAGRDIDESAYAEGSDHWPFHGAGIPGITLRATGTEVLNSPTDDPEAVDPVGVARLSKAVRALLVRLLAD